MAIEHGNHACRQYIRCHQKGNSGGNWQLQKLTPLPPTPWPQQELAPHVFLFLYSFHIGFPGFILVSYWFYIVFILVSWPTQKNEHHSVGWTHLLMLWNCEEVFASHSLIFQDYEIFWSSYVTEFVTGPMQILRKFLHQKFRCVSSQIWAVHVFAYSNTACVALWVKIYQYISAEYGWCSIYRSFLTWNRFLLLTLTSLLGQVDDKG